MSQDLSNSSEKSQRSQPIKSQDLPIKSQDPPIKSQDPPIKSQDPPIKSQDLPIKAQDPPINKAQDHPIIKENSNSVIKKEEIPESTPIKHVKEEAPHKNVEEDSATATKLTTPLKTSNKTTNLTSSQPSTPSTATATTKTRKEKEEAFFQMMQQRRNEQKLEKETELQKRKDEEEQDNRRVKSVRDIASERKVEAHQIINDGGENRSQVDKYDAAPNAKVMMTALTPVKHVKEDVKSDDKTHASDKKLQHEHHHHVEMKKEHVTVDKIRESEVKVAPRLPEKVTVSEEGSMHKEKGEILEKELSDKAVASVTDTKDVKDVKVTPEKRDRPFAAKSPENVGSPSPNTRRREFVMDQQNVEKAKAMFVQFDGDHDGKLTQDEFWVSLRNGLRKYFRFGDIFWLCNLFFLAFVFFLILGEFRFV